MSNRNIIRAWKDEEYRLSLPEAALALLPAHPAGVVEPSGVQARSAGGGALFPSFHDCTWWKCYYTTQGCPASE